MGTARVIQIETDLIVDGQSRRSVSTNCSIKLISCREKQVGREEPGYGASAVQLGGTINGQSVFPTKSRSMGKKLAKLVLLRILEELARCARSVPMPANTARYGLAPGESIIVQSRKSSGERASSCHFIELLNYAWAWLPYVKAKG